MNKRIVILLAMLALGSSAIAQIRLGDGQISGSFESNSIVYMKDKGVAGVVTPDDHFGSNNYLKIDYSYKRFSVGIQADAYLPALQGYEIGAYGKDYNFILSSKYIQWTDKNFSVMVGDIFDQYGNGLIYRSFEDRQLGMNNAVEGIRATCNIGNYIALKAMYGRPRLYAKYAGSWVRGADLSISLSEIAKMQNVSLTLEGSYLNRFERLTKREDTDFSLYGLSTPNLNMYSGRINFDWNGMYIHGEYAHKGKDLPTAVVEKAVKGQALLVEAGYNYRTLSISAQARALDNMGTMISLYGEGTGNALNYLPALTRQYTYMLANLNPYQVNVEGEIGVQADVYYSLRSKSDRHRYWNFHANYSTYYTLRRSQSVTGNRELLWRDANFDVERQWNKKLKTTFLYSFQEWNPYHGHYHRTYVSNIFVADVTYKFDRTKSLRAEAQYLLSNEYEGDWIGGLVEFNMAPHWSFFASDMYNPDKMDANDGKRINYYSVGASYTKNRTRVQLSYGRNRAGYVCSGGVCRYSPAYTGFCLTLTSSF